MYRIREIETGRVAPWDHKDDFDPLFYTPPDCYLLEFEIRGQWLVYTRPTIQEVVAMIQGDIDEAQAKLNNIDEWLPYLESIL